MDLYRYRPLNIVRNSNGEIIKTILDEIENQELFFATLDSNNDPMDGIQQVFWEGDYILWNNLFRHYCLCLMNTILALACSNQNENEAKNIISIFLSPINLNKPHEEFYYSFLDKCFEIPQITNFFSILVYKKKWYFEELHCLFNIIHPKIIDILLNTIGLKNQNCKSSDLILDKLVSFDLYLKNADQQIQSHAFNMINLFFESNSLMFWVYHSHIKKTHNINSYNVIFNFIKDFLMTLSTQLFRPNYISCFSSVCDNSSMWGHYGDHHKGVCLIFNTDSSGKRQFIETTNNTKLTISKVKYGKNLIPINFFEKLGLLTTPHLEKFWLSLDLINFSEYSSIYNKIKKFQQRYWHNYKNKCIYKTNDWKHESEYRATKSPLLRNELTTEKQLEHYNFKHFKGIIFGAMTPIDIKFKIMDIIFKKLTESSLHEFNFYQAYFSHDNNKIKKNKLIFVNPYYKKDELNIAAQVS